MSGVYFLIKDDDTIYIGQSANIAVRLSKHKVQNYDLLVTIECPTKSQRMLLERRMLFLIRPVLNVNVFKIMYNTQIRLPFVLADKVKESADKAKRSMNKEIELVLEERFP